jgi:hypothetical protein
MAAGIAFLSLPNSSDFSDLDVRDAQNKGIESPAAVQELTTLFRENLVNLTVFAPPHAMTETFNWMDSFSHLFNKLIIVRLSVFFGVVQEAILPSTRRFVHNVHNLCTSFSVGQFRVSTILAASTSPSSPRIINLRC